MLPPEPIRFSHLRDFGMFSPAHYRYRPSLGDSATDSIAKGSAGHAMVWNNQRVVCFPGKQRRGAEWEQFRAEYASSLIVTPAQFDAAQAMRDAVMAHKIARKCVEECTDRERTILWNYCGLPCRSTPDGFNRSRVVSLKTCRTAKPEWFTKIAMRSAYHAAEAWYGTALTETGLCGKYGPDEYITICVENSPPYVVTVFRMTPRAIDAGHRLWRSWFERLKGALENDCWPGYSEAVVDLDVPDEIVTFGEGLDDDGTDEEARDAA